MARRVWIVLKYTETTEWVQATAPLLVGESGEPITGEPLFDDNDDPIMVEVLAQVSNEITQEARDAAAAENCGEIVLGIPLALQDIILVPMLPCAYEEPEIISKPTPIVRDVLAELDELKARIDKL